MASIELDIWRGEWGLASIDLECLKVLVCVLFITYLFYTGSNSYIQCNFRFNFQTYMKFIGVPVKVRECSNPFFTPKGALPVMKDGRTILTNFEEVVEYLKSLVRNIND